MKKYLLAVLLVVLTVFAGQVIAQEAEEPTTVASIEDKTEEPVIEPILNIEGFACGVAVEERELQGETETFSPDVEKIYCWTLITGCEEPTTVEHVWYHAGEEMARVPLAIKYPRMRTWSSKTMMPEWAGDWKVEMVDEAGKVLASTSFTVE